MKRKLIIFLLIVLISVFVFNIKSYAVTLPHLMITSNNYSVGDKLNFDTEINVVEVGKTLQLYALTAHGNEMHLPDIPDSTGWFVDEINLSEVTWSSSDTSIATIDNQGKLTGLKEGRVTITALNNDSAGPEETQVTGEFEIIKSSDTTNYSLKISSNNNTSLPESMNVNDKLQLKAILDSDNESTPSEDVTSDVTWTSSDEKIVKVDNNGLLTAIGKGSATITATYKNGDETLTAIYSVKVNASSITPVNPGKKDDSTVAPSKTLPNTGIGITIALIGSIILITICGIAVFSKYKKLKDVR